ncbi:hypothetical protein AWW72_13225 [Acinetobacter sp. NRRL B-65365]|uniref:replication protein n=1 Tax=Acinetobacter sp. NRRL B-65365 TaxID=1785092 RepID=UPI0007A02C37|nr:replication protein [Acinetobacter sp. NRRL B-65365]KYQ83544.1 hypothetical protein AWW72_13225 [Acinetobacter sp. NRRL B-65365]
MPNLAHIPPPTQQGEVVQFPKKEHATMSKIERGYTRLPNMLIDDLVMAQLSDKAFKCLMFIVRQTVGFDRDSDNISITQFQSICGIKKRDTVMAVIKELEDCKIIKVDRKKGCWNVYFFTPNQYHETGLVPRNGTSTTKRDETSTVKKDGTSTTKRDTTKENSKETPKENKKNKSLVDKSESEMFSNSIQYHVEDNARYTLRELANVYMIKTDFADQAKKQNPELTDESIVEELKNFAQWSTGREPTTAQGWMNYWIYRIQSLSKPKTRRVRQSKPSGSKNLSDSQIDMFSKKLCALSDFACTYANTGESQKTFESRIATKLRDPENLKHWASYLRDVGFVGNLEGMA